MEIPILLERIPGNGYRARSAGPFAVTARGATREEALAKLRDKIEARLDSGTELLALEIGPQPHPWRKYAGMFKDDPDFKDVLQIMAENRRKMNEDPDVP
jgi:hypothetical protein